MYRAHFRLTHLPFKSTPDDAFFFGAAERGEVVDALEYIVARRDSIVKVTGEVGSGKTTLLRVLAERLKKRGFHIVYVPTPRLNAEEMLRYIARDLGIEVSDSDSKVDLYGKIYNYLLTAYHSSSGVVVLIDEAHTMPLDTLEEVRLLSNIETGKEKLLTIVLFGQPELDETLRRPEARQLKSRIAHEFYIRPLTDRQVYEYLNFRMQKAGYNGEEVFSLPIAKRIRKLSKGLPRVVNAIADKLLMAAYSRGGYRVEKKDFAILSSELRACGFRRAYLLLLIFLLFLGFAANEVLDRFSSLADGANVRTVGAESKPAGYSSGHGRSQAAGSMSLSDRDVSIEHVNGGNGENGHNRLQVGEKSGVQETLKSKMAAVPWQRKDPDALVAVLATLPCEKEPVVRKVMKKAVHKPVVTYRFEKEGVETCLYAVGTFSTLSQAKLYIEKLPNILKTGNPYPIEVKKFVDLIEQRKARLYE